MPWQFLVVDGADAKSVFPLPERGVVKIGRSHEEVDIYLNDLFVARVHCQVELTPDGKVVAKHLYGSSGSFVNKEKIDEHELKPGDILRVGNTHLRLEPAQNAGPAPRAKDAPAQAQKTTNLDLGGAAPGERLGHLQGQRLSHYEVGQLLAHNEFRSVYVAQDTKNHQTVVLKVLAPQFPSSDKELQHFAGVMRKALPLRYERLVTLLGVGRSGPFTWVAREHVAGESLTDVLQRMAMAGRTRPKWQRALQLAVEGGRALAYLHQQHLMHGHVAPPNVLFDSATHQTKLANVLFAQALEGSRLAQAMQKTRTPADVAYLSPEQCEPGAYVDELSDVYSLGAIVYARLTGRPPLLADNVSDTIELIRIAPLIHPRKLNPTIPPEFETVVLKMLERHQEDRFPSISAVLSALEAFASELTVESGA